MSTGALISTVAAIWFVGAVPVSLAVGKVLRQRSEPVSQPQRAFAAAGRHRRAVTAEELPAHPGLQAPVVVAAQVTSERCGYPIEPCRHSSPVG